MIDKLKLIVAILIFIAAIWGYYAYADVAQLYRVIALLIAAGIAVALALTTERGRFVWSFVGEARIELRKVVWPNRRETVQTTLLVIVMVLIAAVFLWLLDMGLGAGVEMFISREG